MVKRDAEIQKECDIAYKKLQTAWKVLQLAQIEYAVLVERLKCSI